MLKEARIRAISSTFVRGDAVRLPFKVASFEAVFMSFTLEIFDDEDAVRVLAECKRTLKPGGRICVISMAAEKKPGIIGRAYEWSHRMFPGIVDCRPIALKAVLSEAGFLVVESRRISIYGLPAEILLANV